MRKRHVCRLSFRFFCFNQRIEIRFEDILIDDLDIVRLPQGFPQNRNEILVNLDGDDLLRALRRFPGQHPDPGSDLNHQIPRSDARALDNLIDDVFICQKILSKTFGQPKSIFLFNLPNGRWRV